MRFHDKDNYQALINEIIIFFIEFIRGNEENLFVVANYYPLFTKRYSYEKLPELLSALFTKTSDK
jgi:hypothetical protein